MSEQTQLLGEQQDESVPLVPQGDNAPTNNNNATGNEEEEEEEEETLEDYAEMVVTILQPVAITMMLVVWVVRLLHSSNIVLTSRYFIGGHLLLFLFALANNKIKHK